MISSILCPSCRRGAGVPAPSTRLGVALALVLAGCGSGTETEAPRIRMTDEGVVELTPQEIGVAEIEWASVQVSRLSETVTVPGSVLPPDTAQAAIGSIVDGRVVRVHVVAGDRVGAGDALIEVHSHEVSDAIASLESARADWEFADAAAGRAERLHEVGAISLEELQRRRTTLRATRTEVDRAREMLEHLHPSETGNATAVAPREGVVFSVDAKPGQAVLSGDPLLVVGATDPLWVVAWVPEGTAAALDVGDEVEVRFGALDNAPSRARVVRYGQFVNPGTRAVEARLELIDPPETVRPGTFATVDVPTGLPFDGVDLPQDAAVRVAGEDVVFIVEGDGRFRPVAVDLRPLGEGRVAATGIPATAQVVIRGAYVLKSVLESGAEGEA